MDSPASGAIGQNHFHRTNGILITPQNLSKYLQYKYCQAMSEQIYLKFFEFLTLYVQRSNDWTFFVQLYMTV